MLKDSVSSIQNAKILCIGDIMLDQFTYGTVERISPEAPIPVLKIEEKTEMLGGAGNVLRNIDALEAQAHILTRIGHDQAGDIVKKMMDDLDRVSSTVLAEKNYTTSLKARFIAGQQQIMRADEETIKACDLETQQALMKAFSEQIVHFDVVILSDYGKGLLADDVISHMISIANTHKKPVIIDPKRNSFEVYAKADLITPNLKELSQAVGQKLSSIEDIKQAARELISMHQFKSVLVTCGPEGMVLVNNDGQSHHLPTVAQDVFDVSGAGDTVVATVAAFWGAGLTLEVAVRYANQAAGLVVAKQGTAIVSLNELCQQEEHSQTLAKSTKIYDVKSALETIQSWKTQGDLVGFTNGCFDILHQGHLSLLSQARAKCDRLIVAVNSDTSVKRLKGTSRPVQDEETRSAVLAALQDVDMVIIFEEDTPYELIEKCEPDLLVKGADYKVSEVVGANLVQSRGGKVVLIDILDGYSTTKVIEKMHVV